MELNPVVTRREEALAWLEQRVPNYVQEIFKRHVPGKSFADLGCMWNCHGAYTFYAESLGAKPPLLGVDMGKRTESFRSLHAALESKVRFLQRDILELDPQVVGRYDVVFCSGVLYHIPDPMRLLASVTALTKQTLILTTHTIEGDEPIMRLYPHDPRPETYPWEVPMPGQRDYRFTVRYPDTEPWWFAPTQSCVTGMLATLGFTVSETYRTRLQQVPGDPLNPQISFFVAQRAGAPAGEP